MKRICTIFIILLLIVLTSCKTTTSKDSEVLSLELKNTENISVYQNDIYTPNGVVVYAVYEKKKVDVTKDASFSSIDTESTGNKEVTVTYKALSVSYIVQVVTPPPATTLSLAIKRLPNKMEYYVGEEIDLTGIIVAVMRNGEEEAIVDFFSLRISILFFGKTVSGFSEIGPYEIVISAEYGVETLSTHIFVDVITNPTTLPKEMLRVNTDKAKTDYLLHESFDSNGLVVYIEDENGITTEISLHYCTITILLNGLEHPNLDSEGMYTIRVEFRNMKAYYSINVVYREPVRRLLIDYSEAVIQYKIHDAYTSSGLLIQYMEDNVVKAIVHPANCQIKFYLEGVEHISFDTLGTYEIVIEYEGITESYYVSVI